jgi:hypothetical protein
LSKRLAIAATSYLMTRRDEILDAVYREHPRLRILSTGVEAMVDWFLRDPDGFKKHMARHERLANKSPVAEQPRGECILTCVSKRSADEIEADPIPDGAQPSASVGDDVEVLPVAA